MTTPEFKPGDIVRLTCGGPFMTVTYLSAKSDAAPHGAIGVAWFDENGVLHRETFEPGALVHDERPMGAPRPPG